MNMIRLEEEFISAVKFFGGMKNNILVQRLYDVCVVWDSSPDDEYYWIFFGMY